MSEASVLIEYTKSIIEAAEPIEVKLVTVFAGGGSGIGGSGINLDGSVAVYANLPNSLTSADSGQAWLVAADRLIYIWNGSSWPADGSGISLQGPDGKPGQIRFTGHGVPGTIIGASPDDTYLDLDTGTIYKLT